LVDHGHEVHLLPLLEEAADGAVDVLVGGAVEILDAEHGHGLGDRFAAGFAAEEHGAEGGALRFKTLWGNPLCRDAWSTHGHDGNSALRPSRFRARPRPSRRPRHPAPGSPAR